MIRPFRSSLIIILILEFIGPTCIAQHRNPIENITTGGNIFVIGINNEIEINAPDIPLSRLHVNFYSDKVKGEIHKTSMGKYIVTVSGVGQCRIDICDGTSIVTSQVYSCRYPCIGPPTLTSGYIGGNIQAANIKTQKGVVVQSLPPSRYKVKGFTMTYKTNDGVATSTTDGPDFNERMKSFISRAKVGDSYIIDDITIIDSAGNSQKLHNLTFSIL